MWLDKLPDWLTAAGTLAAVGVAVAIAVTQGRGTRAETASRTYFDHAVKGLRAAVEDFTGKTDTEGRPFNGRLHWLNFARGVLSAQGLASKIATPELRDVWERTEHYWRMRVYDVLQPDWDSFPTDYYGYSSESERIKNFSYSRRDREPLAEPSLVFVYRWIRWPEGYVDALDKGLKFTDSEIDKMESFGPRGVAAYIRIRREGVKRILPKSGSGDALAVGGFDG